MDLDLPQQQRNENLRKLRRIIEYMEDYTPEVILTDASMMEIMDFFNEIRRVFMNFRDVENPTNSRTVAENCEIAETMAKTIEEALGPDDDDELIMMLKSFFLAVESIVQEVLVPSDDDDMGEILAELSIPTL